MIRRALLALLLTLAVSGTATALAPGASAGTDIGPLSAGAFHTCALTPAGGVQCWGAGGDGALGTGSTSDSKVPVDANVVGGPVAAISAGWYHTCVLTTAGGGRCWGDNTGGQLGDGTTEETATPTPVMGFEDAGLEAISGGAFHTCAIASGAVVCWGANTFGQLGTGDTTGSREPVANPTLTGGVSAIAAGHSHTCAIATGDVWCWGDNSFGQLGDGTQVERHEPVPVQGLTANAIAVVTGDSHTCALLVGGTVQCWGDNGYGELGDGSFDPSASPRQVTGLDSGVTAISSRGNTTCALRAGAVLCWGDNLHGQVGDGTSGNSRGEPIQVDGLASGVVEIAAGYYHSCALTGGGGVKCWGWNNFGQLGDGTDTNRTVPVDVVGTFVTGDSTPPVIDVPGDLTVEATSPSGASVDYRVTFSDPDDPVATSGCTPESGATFALGVTTVTCTATDAHGNSESTTFHVTVSDTTPPTISGVPADMTATAGPSGDAEVAYTPPTATDLVTAAVIVGCSPAPGSTFALGTTRVRCSASDGNGNTAHASFSVTVVAPLPVAQVRLAAGGLHTCAIHDSGALRCWGSNLAGQLGDGQAPTDAFSAVAVQGLQADVASVTAGAHHVCAVTTHGAALCWGSNTDFQTSDPVWRLAIPTPIPVNGLDSGVAALSAGGRHTCALTTGGAVLCWGNGEAGQLGIPVIAKATPTPVPGLTSGVIAIAAGGDHTCAVLSGGAARCWGDNWNGQLGGGTTAEQSLVPIPVTGLDHGVVAIAGGLLHTCAVTADGDVKCWGDNSFGELGDGTFDASPTPVSVVGLPGPVRAIATGTYATCAVTTLGAVWCWGANTGHQLGNDSNDPSSVRPVPVSGLGSGVISIAGGSAHFCAISSGPFVQCWGWNDDGQLGDESFATRSTPVAVHHFGADMSIGDVTVDEGDSGTSAATFTISLSEPSTETVTVLWSTLGIDAFSDQDFERAVDTATFAPGETAEQIAVNVFGDTDVEPDELFSVRLERASNAAILGSDTGYATIRNDDTPRISVDDVSVDEGDTGTSPATFAVTLDRPSIHPVTVAWTTLAVDATAGSDYVSGSGSVTFAPGEVDESITVDVLGDTTFEPDETFQVVLSSATQAVIDDGSGTGTITNDETVAPADVTISTTADHGLTSPVAPGQRLVFTISVANLGPGTATNVQITDALPAAADPSDARWCEMLLGTNGCSLANADPYPSSTGIPAIASLASGDRRTFQVGYTVAADQPRGTIRNLATVASTSPDPVGTNNAAAVSVLVDAPPVASFTWSPDQPVAGGLVRFDATGSSDDAGITRYEWRFSDGVTATGATAGHSFETGAVYGIELRVFDAFGRESLATQRIEVARNTAPSAHRALTGTVTQLQGWSPGDETTPREVPLAGATVSVTVGGGGTLTTTTDAQGDYSFVNLACGSGCYVGVRSGGTLVATPPKIALGPDPSTTLLDIATGDQVDRLFLSGRVVPPDVPPTPAPAIAIRIYGGPTGGPLLADSASQYGQGGWGTYRLALGRVSTRLPWASGNTLRVVLVENGSEVRSTTVTIPAQTGAAVQVMAADLVGVDTTPSAHRALTGTVTRLLDWGPGEEPEAASVPLAGATVTTPIGGGQSLATITDANGGYRFVNLGCGTNCFLSVRENGTIVALPPKFSLGPDPSTTRVDIATADQPNRLLLSGRAVQPPVQTDPDAPLPDITIRVYRANGSGALLADSSVAYGGAGGWGTYRLALGIAGTSPYQVGTPLRVVLVENGVEVRSTTVTVPALTSTAVQVSASDLSGVDPAPSFGRSLTGSVTQLADWGPGGGLGPSSHPLAGATVTVAGGGSTSTVTTTTHANGIYLFDHLTCGNACTMSVRSGGTVVALPPKFALGPNPSRTSLDVLVGTQPNQLFVSGRLVAPDPFKQAPVIAVRVYRGNARLADSGVLYGGIGGWGTYRLALGVVGTPNYPVGATLRVALVENGVEVSSTTVTIPALTYAAIQVQAADLLGQ